MRVLLTREPAQAGSLEAGLRAETGPDGKPFEVGFLPLTATELPDEAGMGRLRAAVADLAAGAVDVLLVTSPNGARALAAAGWDGRVPAGVRVAATGPGTVRVLCEVGLRASAGSADGGEPDGEEPEVWVPEHDRSAAGILAELPGPARSGARLLLPQSARAADQLADGLRARGWDVCRVEAYRTVAAPGDPARRLFTPLGVMDERSDGREPEGAVGEVGDVWAPDHVWTPARLAEAPADVVILCTSPSAAEELVGTQAREVVRAGRVPCVALGRPTEAALTNQGVPVAARAATPDAPGVVAALRSL